jgi:hypothetical protein
VNPQAAVYTWTTNAGRFGHFLTSPRVMSARMNMLFDSPVQEWWLDEVNHGATVVPAFGAAYVRALTLGRTGASEPYLLSRGNPYSGSSFPTHEVTVRAMMALTNGSITPLMIPNNVEKDFREATMVEIGKRKKWFVRTKQEPWAALLVSEQTRQFYAKNQVMDRFLAHPLGVFRVGWEEHLPINLITDWDIRPERLKPYKVLVLPNAAALSDRQVQVIRAYVAGGGGLIATCETSLFDELGQPRANFALADVFGVDYLGRPSAPTTREAMDVNAAILADDGTGYPGKLQGPDGPDERAQTAYEESYGDVPKPGWRHSDSRDGGRGIPAGARRVYGSRFRRGELQLRVSLPASCDGGSAQVGRPRNPADTCPGADVHPEHFLAAERRRGRTAGGASVQRYQHNQRPRPG